MHAMRAMRAYACTFPALQALGPAVPYLAVISAGSCNVGFTRMDEIQ